MEIEVGKIYWCTRLKSYVEVVSDEGDYFIVTRRYEIKESELKCAHMTAKIYSEMYRAATLEEPEEYDAWTICKDCGEKLSLEDEPEGADWK